MSLKSLVKRWESSDQIVQRATFRVGRTAWSGYRLLTDPGLRAAVIGGWLHRRDYHQLDTYTSANRYAPLFDECRERLDDSPQRRVLSYGCSTGEEVVSLAERWPQAAIVGVDINAWCIAECRRRHQAPQRTFLHRLSREFDAAGGFDAIFCLAVFQRQENRTRRDNARSAYRFEQFERDLAVLDGKLKPGGLFVIDNADFRFTDAACASVYMPVMSANSQLRRGRPLYDRHNQKIADQHASPRIFVKRPGTPAGAL
jgi:hypothetical protein